ncbi:MAG: MFS transporter, partial [Burkholderiales bacterium]|nr:MFS transporter [Burkholderiales bacterium]
MPDTDRPASADTAPPADELGALAPFRHGVFTMLWGTWLIANLCMWMNDVAAAWLMTTLTATPIWVALVQTAATLPVFLLGLPSGALADILDRRRFLLFTQIWVAVVGIGLAVAVLLDAMTPLLLLLLIFCNGIGLALRWPVFAAIVPELVPRTKLPAALALNGVSMNAARILGPLVAGALIAGAGSAWVFLLNAALSVAAALIISRWRREHRPHPLGREPLPGAMRVGLQYVRQSYHLKGVMLRVSIFFFHSTALMALLPLVARELHGGGPGTFTLMLSCVGLGAIVAALLFPRWRERYSRGQFVVIGSVVHAALSTLIVLVPEVWVAIPAMVVIGMAWISVANSLTVAAQQAMPDWVRARGMSIYQMSLMGGSAAGSLLWGQVAGISSVQTAVLLAAVVGLVVVLATRRLSVDWAADI